MISTLQPRSDDNAQKLLWKIAQTIGLLSFGGCVLPVAPGSLAVVAGNNQNTLTWSAVADATSYNIKRALVTGGPYTTIDTDTASPYVDSAVSSGTDYFYVVSAVNACGESANSNQSHGCVLPVAPGSLAVVAGKNQNTLTWSAVVGATSYNIKRALVTGGPYTTIDTDTASPYVDATAVAGTDYFYVVSAVNACGEGANSNEAHGVPTGDFQWTPVAQNVDWTDGGGAHTGNLANFNATAVKATTTIIQFDGHAVETISYFGEANLPALSKYSSAACNSLTSINSPDLASLGTTFSSVTCPALTSVNLSGLISVTSSIAIQTANAMTSLNLSSLTTVGGLYLNPVNSLVTLNVPSLTTTLDFYTFGSTNLLTINAPALTAVTTDIFCFSCAALTTANFQSLQTVGRDFYIYSNSNLTSLNLPSLITVSHNFHANTDTKLTTLSCPAFTGAGLNQFRFNGCTLLANVSLPVWLPNFGRTIDFSGCALTAASVNHLLARCIANAGWLGSLIVNAGTNSAPTGQGIIDKATLIARGCAITTN